MSKIRLDYVTNSSSSSFIIGKCDENITIDDVFIIIRDLYKELIEKVDSVVSYIKDHPELHLSFSDEHGLCFNKKETEFMTYEKEMNIRDRLEKDFGVNFWDVFYPKNKEWLSFNTYEEYKNFWIKEIKKSGYDYNIHAPFTIVDFKNPETTYLHFHDNHDICIGIENISAESEIYDWYSYKNDKLSKEFDPSACLKLGRFYISSECGYIPGYIVERLYCICEYACNHMG